MQILVLLERDNQGRPKNKYLFQVFGDDSSLIFKRSISEKKANEMIKAGIASGS